MTRLRSLIASACLGAVLTACAGTPAPEPVSSGSGAVPEAAAPAPAAPAVASLPPLPRIAAGEVLGYSRSDLVAAFGAPVFSRIDKGVEILRFRGESCVLDMFLYRDAKDAPARVRYFEARDGAGKNTDRTTCVNQTPRARG